ncbi:hypothetical protein KFK09_024537 [Dendrobium nobile]|uniref:Uncharacterized protein n=1 Tax=Dendrobium nobile TaxID=94219 RepID=A0A8T3AEB1_DENNO|nr:hypothetical protein KFK09_024537 [Dendrobium nobile]
MHNMKLVYIKKFGAAPVIESHLRRFGHINYRTSYDPTRIVDVFDPMYVKKGRDRIHVVALFGSSNSARFPDQSNSARFPE